jgi:hypothetical protein
MAASPAGRPPVEATDNATIMARINAADPALTRSPTSVADLVAVAELAERKLASATAPDDVGELLIHVATAREIAHERTGAADHLCKLLAATTAVIARAGLPTNLHTEATDFTARTRATLSARHPGHTCASATRTVLPTVAPKPAVAWTPPPVGQDRPKAAPMTITGGVLLGTTVALTLGLAGVRVHRGRAGNELGDIRSEVEMAGGKTVEQDERIAELEAINTWTRGATMGLGVSTAVLGVLGVGLVAAGSKRQRTQQARLTPYGGPQGAGIALQGRF